MYGTHREAGYTPREATYLHTQGGYIPPYVHPIIHQESYIHPMYTLLYTRKHIYPLRTLIYTREAYIPSQDPKVHQGGYIHLSGP